MEFDSKSVERTGLLVTCNGTVIAHGLYALYFHCRDTVILILTSKYFYDSSDPFSDSTLRSYLNNYNKSVTVATAAVK